jgi:hypothetical protein
MGEVQDMKAPEMPSAFSRVFGYDVAKLGSVQDIEPDYKNMSVKKVVEVL